MKIGVSRRSMDVSEALQHFDYAEAWDIPVAGQAHHLVRGRAVDPKYYLYVCSHMNWDYLNGAHAENITSMTYKQVKRYLEMMGTKFLLDVGHAYISDTYYEHVPFSVDRWLELKPEVVHLHNVKRVTDEASGLPTDADHQLFSKGKLDLKPIVRKVEAAGVKYLTVEVFMEGQNIVDYSSRRLRKEIDAVL